MKFKSLVLLFCCAAFLNALGISVWEMDVSQLKAGVAKGDPDSELALARAYEFGQHGAKKDPAEALKWYMKAAAQDNGIAMRDIGRLYERGTGVEKNIDRALEWYKKAADAEQRTGKQTFVNWEILRLSRAGLIKEKYAGIPVEGATFITKVDETTPVTDQVQGLTTHADEIETGKGYWIGYNAQMLSIAAQGETAIPFLVDFVTKAADPKARHAGILTLHLIGIGSCVKGAFNEEEFTNRKAREALWGLMKVEGLTDDIAVLLKRDPWPADVPAIMEALAQVKGDCPDTLNGLLRYKIDRRPIDTLAHTGLGSTAISFTLPLRFSDRDRMQIWIDALKAALHEQLQVDDALVGQVPNQGSYQNYTPVKWTGDIAGLLAEMKELRPPFDFCDSGKAIYYYAEGEQDDPEKRPVLHLCDAATAKKRLLDWWRESGREWYVK